MRAIWLFRQCLYHPLSVLPLPFPWQSTAYFRDGCKQVSVERWHCPSCNKGFTSDCCSSYGLIPYSDDILVACDLLEWQTGALRARSPQAFNTTWTQYSEAFQRKGHKFMSKPVFIAAWFVFEPLYHRSRRSRPLFDGCQACSLDIADWDVTGDGTATSIRQKKLVFPIHIRDPRRSQEFASGGAKRSGW